MSKRRAYLAWVVVCLVWGTTYLAIRVAIGSIPPLLMAGFRWMVAGTLLIAFFRARGERLPARSTWSSLAVRGVLLIGFGNGGVVWAEQTVPSGLTAVLTAVAPFWMVGIDGLFKDSDSLNAKQIGGLIVGFAGILLLIWPQLGTGVNGRTFVAGFVSTQLACVGWAIGSAYARRRGRAPNSEATLIAPAYEMLVGGIALLACGFAAGESAGAAAVTSRSAAALVYLIVFGSIVGFSSYRYALQHLPVATVSLYVYANTVIAMILGTLVLGEAFSWRMGVAATVVLTGIALVKNTTA